MTFVSSVLNENANIFEKIFYRIGNNGPFILIVSSLFLLRKRQYYFEFYLLGSIVNIFLNQILKILIKQPRPSVNEKTFELAMKHMKRANYSNLISYDVVLGMPSGHAQGVFFTTAFIFFVFLYKQPTSILQNQYRNIFIVYVGITIITVVQRVYYKFHTINQIIVGGTIGTIFAYILYSRAMKKIKGGRINPREEENGPL